MGTAQTRWFWLGMAIILAAGAVPRLLIYDFSLPYIDYPDEGTSYLEARQWRGAYELGGGHEGYPPGHIALNYAVQLLVEGVRGGGIADTIRAMRLLSVTFNLLAALWIALLARLWAGDVAGWSAALTWALAPMVVTNGVLATPDPLLYMLVSLSFWLAAVAWSSEAGARWALGSFAVGLLAVVVKYPAFPVLMPSGLWALWALRRDVRRGALVLGVMAVAAAAVALGLIAGYGALADFGTNRETVAMQQSGVANLLSLAVWSNNLWRALLPFHAPTVAAVMAIGAGAMLTSHEARAKVGVSVGVLALSAALMVWVVGSFAVVTGEGSLIRHVMPVSALALALFGAGAGWMVARVPSRWHGATLAALAVVFGAMLWGPSVRGLVAQVPGYRLPDTRVDMRLWADVNLEAGTVVVDEVNHKTFNPFWGGIEGRQWFDWWEVDDFMAYPLDEWRDERGMSYMAIPLHKRDAIREREGGAAFLDAMLLLRTFDAPNTRGPQVAFYRLWRMATERTVAFGEAVRLVGWDGPPSGDVSAGESVAFRLYWNAAAVPATNYSLYVHLTPTDSRDVLAQWDGPPTVGARPTVTWTHADEVLISPPIVFALPDDLPAGTYRLIIGLYNFETFERLPVDVGPLPDGYELLRLTVR